MQNDPPSLTAWLWWLSLLILIAGGLVYYLFRVSVPNGHPMPGAANLTIAVTAVLAGVCIISATSKWWMKH